MRLENVLSLAAGIARPLSLAGLVVLVLFLIYKSILRLRVFARLTQRATFLTINSIINKVFLLSVIVVVLSMIAYLVDRRLSSKRSDVKLIDLSVPEEQSIYSIRRPDHQTAIVKPSEAPIPVPKEQLQRPGTRSESGPAAPVLLTTGPLTLRVIRPREGAQYDVEPIQTRHFFPILDLKFKNSGDDVAFFKRLVLEVLDAEIDVTPLLEFRVDAARSGDLLISVTNAGWGAALGVKLNNLLSSIRKQLDLKPEDYIWRGEVHAGKAVELVFRKDAVKEGASGVFEGPLGYVEYADSKGQQYEQVVRYDPYPLELYSIGVGSQGFAVKHRDLAYGARPSCRYSVKLDPERKKYAREYGISHVIPPHGVERFQILLASDKSAVFKLAVRVIYDEDRAVNVPPTTIRIFNPNKLWYYDYIKDRWIGDSGQTPRAVLFGRELTEANDDSKEAEAQIRKSRADRLNELGWTLIEQGIDIEEGIRLAEKARGLLPEDPPILDTVGWGYFMSGAYENAVRVLADAARLAPNDEIIGQHLKRAREASSRQR